MTTKAIFATLPEEIQNVLKNKGINDLYPPQAEAVKKGLLTDKNFVLAMPTASGKTLLAEFAMINTLLQNQGNCLYIVPLRALASEKYEEFKDKYSSLGIKIGIATGDYDQFDAYLTNNNILIATAEKVDSLLRQNPEQLCLRLGCVIVDEIHYIGDPKRGPTLESVITKLRSLKSSLKIVGLSATIANANDIAEWLDATLISSVWRPVDLKEGVYCEGQVIFADGSRKEIDFEHTKEDIAALAIDSIKDKGQVLVFVTTRKSAQAEARRIAKDIHFMLSPEEKKKLEALSKQIKKSTSGGEITKISNQLAEYIKSGVVFHHAGLDHAQRKLIEDNFKDNLIKVICATPTLAVGVNLPSRRTIIRGLYRYISGAGMRPISVMEYKQMSGRAGRPKYDKFGEAILVARNKTEKSNFFNDFIFGDAEPIHSHLGDESALRVHLLAAIATEFITGEKSTFEFISKSFYAYQENSYDLSESILEILDFFETEGMITRKDDALTPTKFGTRISRLYIDPISAVVIRDCLQEAPETLASETLLYLVCSVPDMIKLAFGKRDVEKIIPFVDMNKDKFELPLPLATDYTQHLAKVKTVWMLMHWMDEVKEDMICDFFNIGPGDIHRFVETAEWMLYAIIELSKVLKIPSSQKISDLRTQLRYGIRSELIDLVKLKGIGRTRARNLHNNGIRSLMKLRTLPAEQVQKIPAIGKELALSIKKQLTEV